MLKISIDIIPNIIDTIGIILCFIFGASAIKNKPNIPPLKIEANSHHESNALLTFIIARATIMPKKHTTKEAIYNILI